MRPPFWITALLALPDKARFPRDTALCFDGALLVGVNIYRDDLNAPGNWSHVTTLPPSSEGWLDKDAVGGYRYLYRVTVNNSAGEGEGIERDRAEDIAFELPAELLCFFDFPFNPRAFDRVLGENEQQRRVEGDATLDLSVEPARFHVVLVAPETDPAGIVGLPGGRRGKGGSSQSSLR